MQRQIGLYAIIRSALEQHALVFFQRLWYCLAESRRAEGVLMPARFHKRQIRMIEIALWVYRANIGIANKQSIRRAQQHQIATEIDQRISLSLYLQRFTGCLRACSNSRASSGLLKRCIR